MFIIMYIYIKNVKCHIYVYNAETAAKFTANLSDRNAFQMLHL